MLENNIKPNKLVAIYGRVSTSNQESEGTIETQLSAVRVFAEENNLTVVRQYTDNGWSGDSIVRPGLDQLRMDAKSKLWDAVVFYDPDRVARRYSYQELVLDELRENGVEVIFVTTPAPKDGIEKILYGVQGLFAEYERAKIAERFRLGKVRKAKEGHIIVTEAPYGYTFIKKKGKKGSSDFVQGYYEINEQEASVVKSIFSWVADDGITLRGVVRRLQELNIQPRKSKRGVWATSTLSRLLKNKTYIGEGHYGASYAVVPKNPTKKGGYKKIKKTSRKTRPESEWITIPTPAIIEKDLFDRVAMRLKSNADMSVRNTKNEYLLAGKVWCSCGKRRGGEGPQKGKYLYYRCTDRVKSFPLPHTCHEKGINARVADGLVWEKVRQLMSSPELLVKQAERWLNNKRANIGSSTIDIEETRREIAKLNTQKDRYTKAYGTGVISVEQLQSHIEPVKEKIVLLEDQIVKAHAEVASKEVKTLPKDDEIESFAQLASEQLQDLTFADKKAIVRCVIDKVVGTQRELKVYGFMPINDINVHAIHRNCRPTKRRKINII